MTFWVTKKRKDLDPPRKNIRNGHSSKIVKGDRSEMDDATNQNLTPG